MEICDGLSWACASPHSVSFRFRNTKLYTCFLVLCIFTTFTFAADKIANPED
jgi:hypothetical protein